MRGMQGFSAPAIYCFLTENSSLHLLLSIFSALQSNTANFVFKLYKHMDACSSLFWSCCINGPLGTSRFTPLKNCCFVMLV